MQDFYFKSGVRVTVDFLRGVVAEISRNGRVITFGGAPLFSVKMRNKEGKALVISADQCSFVSYSNAVTKYTCACFDAEIIIKSNGERLLLRANLTNKTDCLFEWIELCPFLVGDKLAGEGGIGEIIYPYNEGCLVKNMAYRESMPFKFSEPDYPSKNTYSIFPNMVFAQFIAYGADGGGIYLGMHDRERTTKHIDFCYFEGGIKIFARTFCDVGYGQNYVMPFDTVLSGYEGDWYSATDIYGEWFNENLPLGLVKISENGCLPKWYGQSPLIVAYPLRGKTDSDVLENGLYPYENALPILEEISQKAESKVMALLMQWEGTAPWAPPYSWPPYGGEEEFRLFVDKAHKKDMLVGLYCSGMGWTYKSNLVSDYCKEKDFESLGIGEIACSDSDGSLSSVICTAQREGLDLCPSTEGAKQILKREFEKICASGVDYLQALDQNHGGNSYFCYSDKHGHTPAPGKWQQEQTNELLERIDKKAVVFGCESGASEPFLSKLQFSDNRFELNYYLGEPIPIYSYLFHEYVNNFMGNQICSMLEKKDNNFTYRLAYSFLAGDMLTVVLGGKDILLHSWCDYVSPVDKHVDGEIALKFIAKLNGWRNNAGRKFLHLGKMVKPVRIECPKERFLLEDGKTYLTVDSVITSAYENNDEKMQFLANYNLYPIEIILDKERDLYFDDRMTRCQKGVKSVVIEPLSIIAFKIQ